MKKINSIHIARFLQIAAIAYLVFVLLADIMKWQSADDSYIVLAISAIVATSELLTEQSDRKTSQINE